MLQHLSSQMLSRPFVLVGSTSADSTNHRSKIFRKKNSSKFQKAKLEFATCAGNYLHIIYIVFTTIYIDSIYSYLHSIYIVFGIINNPVMIERHTNGQQAHEKMLNIINHQRNANQNHNEISPHTCQNGYHQKDHKYQMLVRTWRKGNSLALLVGM